MAQDAAKPKNQIGRHRDDRREECEFYGRKRHRVHDGPSENPRAFGERIDENRKKRNNQKER
jgi:hypothetical protein